MAKEIPWADNDARGYTCGLSHRCVFKDGTFVDTDDNVVIEEDEIGNGFRTGARGGVWVVLPVAEYCLVVGKWQMSVRHRRKLEVL